MTARLDTVRGDATGLTIPAHGDALRGAGADFLTRAFRAFGALAADNEVTTITDFEPCSGGSTGSKFYLTVAYARAEPGLPDRLFVKFSRDFDDERRDHGRREMEPEARFATLARAPDFPIAVPLPLFADYHAASGTGLIITARILYSEGGPYREGAIEAHRRKCLDHVTLDDPLPYYRKTVAALAQLAGAHRGGRLTADVDTRFPFDPIAGSADPIRHSAAELQALITHCSDFAAQCPALLPAQVRTPAFQAQMLRDALKIRTHEAAIQHYLRGNADLIALCHWNAHIDNVWFWRDAADELQCGLIDWGRVGQMTLGSALWGCLSAAHHIIWDEHLDELLTLFCDTYHAHGGPRVAPATLESHLMLHIATMGVARVLVFPEVILFRQPDTPNASGPHDAMFTPVAMDAARNSLHVYTVFLKLWQRRDFGALVDELIPGR